MEQGYAYTTVKKVHILLNEHFRYLTEEGFIQKNPMQSVPMMRKANFLAAQDKECVPEQESVTVFTATEIAKFKREAFSTFSNGKRKYQQAAAYILMLNTGLRTGELLGLLNSDIDLERRVLHLERGVKEVWRRDGLQAEPGRDVKVGKLKSATSKRTIPLNDTAIAMIQDLRQEAYFGEDTPLVPDEHGDYTRPVNFRKRYYRILAAAGIDKKGLHSLRHTFASSLVNGIKQEDGTIKSLTPRQVADLLGHSTSQITELYYVKKDTSRLHGITDGFNLWPLWGRMHKTGPQILRVKRGQKQRNAPDLGRKRRNRVRFVWYGCEAAHQGAGEIQRRPAPLTSPSYRGKQ